MQFAYGMDGALQIYQQHAPLVVDLVYNIVSIVSAFLTPTLAIILTSRCNRVMNESLEWTIPEDAMREFCKLNMVRSHNGFLQFTEVWGGDPKRVIRDYPI